MEKLFSMEKLEALVDFQEKIDRLKFTDLVDLSVKQIAEILKIERCSIFKVSEDFQRVCLIAAEPRDGHGLGMNFLLDELKAVKKIVEDGKYHVINNPIDNELTIASRDLIYYKCINAILFVPFIAGEKVIGVIAIDATGEKKGFYEEEICFCLNIANLIGLLLERDMLLKKEAEKENLLILSRLVDEAADRLRNPLTAIGGFARRLAKKSAGSLFQEEIATIIEEVEKMEANFNQLLEEMKRLRSQIKTQGN
ncbi:GAF domain-containing protein [Candidatus Azambacteria bacterium]|nr:GAF domain-containing protein [Candidatus Azambacteria bacterium]